MRFRYCQFLHPISADHLLTLTMFNLVRDLTTNTNSLGLDPRLMHTDISSTFVSTPLPSRLPNQALHLPPMLRPTFLQQAIPHHPEIDVSPFPEVKDNALLAAGDYDEAELCMDILGLDRTASSMSELDRETDMARTGCLVWGEPSFQGSWEASEGFRQKNGSSCFVDQLSCSTQPIIGASCGGSCLWTCNHAIVTCQRQLLACFERKKCAAGPFAGVPRSQPLS